MNGKNKLFDWGAFIEAVSRLKIPGIIGSALMLSSELILVFWCMYKLTKRTWIEIPNYYFYFTYLVPFVLVPLMMIVAFSYLNSRKTSDFYHSLSVKRETLFFSTVVAVIAWVIALLVVSSIILLVMAGTSSYIEMDMLSYWQIMGKVLVMSLLVLSGFSLGVSLTGNKFTNFFVSVMILLVPRMVSTITCNIAESFTPYLILNAGKTLLNNQYNIILRELDFNGTTIPLKVTILYSTILAAIYLFLGALIFIKRKSEMAGMYYAYKGVHVAARMVIPFIALLGALYCIMIGRRFHSYNSNEMEYVILTYTLLMAAVVIYFVFELIVMKKIESIRKSLLGLAVLFGGVAVIGIIIFIGSRVALERKVDENSIDYLLITDMSGFYEDGEFYRLDNERANQIVAEAYKRQIEELEDYSDYVYKDVYSDADMVVGINLNGTTIYRNMQFEYEEYTELYEIYMNEIFKGPPVVSMGG